MGYVFSFKDAVSVDRWFKKPHNRFVAELENRLLLDMLKPMRGYSVLDIGCGTGINLVAFLNAGLEVSGIDPSPYMLDIATKSVKNRADLHQGFAEDLPFNENDFNYTCINTTLEFVDNPKKVIEEACRVAKDRIFIGVMNRYALKCIHLRLKGMFTESVYKHARFFSIWELKRMIRIILGDIPVSWRTVYHLPAVPVKIARSVEQSNLIQKIPFGAFAGMVVTLVPRFKSRPLALKIRPRQTSALQPVDY